MLNYTITTGRSRHETEWKHPPYLDNSEFDWGLNIKKNSDDE